MLPEGIKFKDLDMKLKADENARGEAVLTYSYKGYTVGSVRAKLSKSYIKDHSAKIRTSKKEDRKSTRLNSSHSAKSRMPSSA